ncbi:MAG: chromate resistance protein ChrB domain-containing protein [Burkholderiaceae bacterium]
MALDRSPGWLLLVLSLPTPSGTARMRVWRALKGLGCMALRDGAYLLPQGEGREEALLEIARHCTSEGGVAWLIAAQPRGPDDRAAWRALFDRSADYAELRKGWRIADRGLGKLGDTELTRLHRKRQRDFDAIRAIDFFPGEASAEAETAWTEFNKRIEALQSPDEPHELGGGIARLDASAYQGRTWATRRHLWVDRVASAWLIRRFIDPKANFLWLARPSECPKRALGFDFDGATFTHVGERVTFETLMASFGLDDDPALNRLAAIIHHLDVGGGQVPEAIGFEAVMTGARDRLQDDDALLAEMSRVLDSLHVHFERAATRVKA